MISPTGTFVLIEATAVEKVSKGGIVLPDDLTTKEQAIEQTGRIIEFGPCAYVKWKGCESPVWFERARKYMASEGLVESVFEQVCEHWKWNDPDYPAHKQWGIEVGDMIEHDKFGAANSVIEHDGKIYRYIPDVNIKGVIRDE